MENAFKHGASEQLEKPWLSVDIAAKQQTLKCKIVNSKNEVVPVHKNGIGIENVKKRFAFLYPGKHELKLSDEGAFFVVADSLQPVASTTLRYVSLYAPTPLKEKAMS